MAIFRKSHERTFDPDTDYISYADATYCVDTITEWPFYGQLYGQPALYCFKVDGDIYAPATLYILEANWNVVV